MSTTGVPTPPAVGTWADQVLKAFHQQVSDFQNRDNYNRTQVSQDAITRWLGDQTWRAAAHLEVPPPDPLLLAHWTANDNYTITISYGPETVIPPYVEPPPPAPLPDGVMDLAGNGTPNRFGDIPATYKDTKPVGFRVTIGGIEYQRIEVQSPFTTYKIYRPVENIGKD
jgi:hypothetical protein